MKKNTQGFDIAILVLSVIIVIAFTGSITDNFDFPLRDVLVPSILFGSVTGYLYSKKLKTKDEGVKNGLNVAIIALLALLVSVWTVEILSWTVGYKQIKDSIVEPIISTVILSGAIIAFQVNKAKSKTKNVANDILSLILLVAIAGSWINNLTEKYWKNRIYTTDTEIIIGSSGSWLGYAIAIVTFSLVIVYLLILRNKQKK